MFGSGYAESELIKEVNGLNKEREELIETIENQQDTINEIKNKIEQQKIMINKMKSCYNCNHSVWSFISDEIECCHPKKELRNTCEDKYTYWEIINNGQ